MDLLLIISLVLIPPETQGKLLLYVSND